MFDTVVGVLGLGASVAGLWTNARDIKKVTLRLDDVDKSITTIKALLEETIANGPDKYFEDVWREKCEEIAFQIVRRATQRLETDFQKLDVILADPRRFNYVLADAEASKSSADLSRLRPRIRPSLILSETPLRLSATAPQGYADFISSSAEKRPLFANPEPIYLATPENPVTKWSKKLAEIGVAQKEMPEIRVDNKYWREAIERLGT